MSKLQEIDIKYVTTFLVHGTFKSQIITRAVLEPTTCQIKLDSGIIKFMRTKY